jgi:hypothetical protein
MIDHLMLFTGEVAALDALPAHHVDGTWSGNVVAGQTVGFWAVWSEPDENGSVTLLQPAVRIPGFFLTVSLPDVSRELIDMSNLSCRLVADRSTGSILYAAADLDAALIASAIISPVPAGAPY